MRTEQTITELNEVLGSQVREARVARNLDQAALARLADISVATLSALERGKGSSVSSLIAVVRALGRTDWLESLTPVATVSPMQLLRAKGRTPSGRRVKARRSSARHMTR